MLTDTDLLEDDMPASGDAYSTRVTTTTNNYNIINNNIINNYTAAAQRSTWSRQTQSHDANSHGKVVALYVYAYLLHCHNIPSTALSIILLRV